MPRTPVKGKDQLAVRRGERPCIRYSYIAGISCHTRTCRTISTRTTRPAGRRHPTNCGTASGRTGSTRNISIICIVKFASKVWFDKLPSDLQRIILEEAAIADARILPFSIALINKLYGIWEKTGGELNVLSDAEQTELRRRLSTVGDDVLKDQPEVLKVYKIMKAVAARTRKR